MGPESREHLLLDSDKMNDFLAWTKDAKRGNICILKAASAGCGVSTMIRLILEELRCEPIIVTTGVQRLRDFLRDTCDSLYTAIERKKKVVVLDPVDALFADQTAAGDILEFLKTEGSRSVPIVCAGFLQRASLARMLDVIDPKKCTSVSFPIIEKQRAVEYLSVHYGSTPIDRIETVWDSACGDLRACLSALDMETDQVKDIVCDGAEAIQKVLFEPGVTLTDAVRMHDGDAQLMTMGIFENYHLAEPGLDQAVAVTDAFSMADIVDERMYGNQEWCLGDFYAALTAGVPAVCLPKTVGMRPVEKFGSVWSRGNNQRSKEKSLRHINLVGHENSRQPLGAADLSVVRSMFLHCSKNAKYDMFSQLAEGLDDATVLSIMRLFKTKYTQTDHSKFKRARGGLVSKPSDP